MSAETRGDLLGGGLFFLLFVIASILGAEDVPVLSDNQHYFFIAERAASGVPPHVSHFDPKNALSMLMTAGAIGFGRVFGIDDLVSSRIISLGVAALAIGLTWPIARRLTGSTIAAWVACSVMLALNRFMFMAIMGSQPKVFLVLFVLLSLYAMTARREALAGAAAGAAFLCWQPALMLVAAGPVALWMGGAGWRAGLRFLAVAFALFGIYEAYFLYHGALNTQLYQAYYFPYMYMESLPTALNPVLRRARWVLAISQGVTESSIIPIVFLTWLGVVWTGWWRRGSLVAEGFRGRPDRLYFALLAHGAFLLCLQSYQGFPDRFLLDPFMAIAAGWIVAGVVMFVANHTRLKVGAIPISLLCAVVLIVLAAQNHWNFRDIHGLASQRRAGKSVGALLDAGYSVYAVGCTHLLAFNHANNFTRFGFFFRGVGEYMQARTSGRGYRPLRNGKAPDVVLMSRGKYMDQQRWFLRHYAPTRRDDFASQSVQVWLRMRRR